MKALHALRYGFWLTGQVIVAATDVIVDNLRIHQKQKPVLIGLPVRVRTDFEVALFAESITMTPGTLVCGVRELADDSHLFIVHAIFGADLDGLYDSLYDMEEHMLPSLRGAERPEAFVFEEYDPHILVDPEAVVGTALETERGLPLPDGLELKGAVPDEARSAQRSEVGSEPEEGAAR